MARWHLLEALADLALNSCAIHSRGALPVRARAPSEASLARLTRLQDKAPAVYRFEGEVAARPTVHRDAGLAPFVASPTGMLVRWQRGPATTVEGVAARPF